MGGGDESRMNSYQELTIELNLLSFSFDLSEDLGRTQRGQTYTADVADSMPARKKKRS
jgi:hypothetical protein